MPTPGPITIDFLLHDVDEDHMPIEYTLLKDQPIPVGMCPYCQAHLDSSYDRLCSMRGLVQRSRRPWWRLWSTRPYCAVICPACLRIAAWEEPIDQKPATRGPYR